MSKNKVRNWTELDSAGRERHRFDFVSEVVSTDDKTQTARLRLEPDPRRYTISELDGQRCYIDKFLKIAIPDDVVYEMMVQHLGGAPISYGPPSIASASKYAESQRAALIEEVQGASYLPPREEAFPQKELFEDSKADFVSFISIDIVGSTALRHNYGDRYDKAYEYFLRELLTSVGHFRGAVLNVTGDGFIAYVDLPGFTTQCDNTVDLGLTLLRILGDSINPALEEADLPVLSIRVGADVGKAVKRSVEIQATNFQSFDIGSAALNRAVKIEKEADAGQFLIGRALYELLHVAWLERCQPVSFDNDKLGTSDYQVYEII